MRVRDPAANGYKTHSAIAPPVSGLAVLVLKPLLPYELTQYIDAERIGRLLWVADVMLRLSPWLRQTVKTLFPVRCKFIVPHPGTVLG